MPNLCKGVGEQVTKCKNFANFLFVISVNIHIKWFASKTKFFASCQNPCANGLQVKKTLCKSFSSGSQVVHKPFKSGLFTSKPIQTLCKLVGQQVIKQKWLRNGLFNKHLLSKALQGPQLSIIQYIGFASSIVSKHLLSLAFYVSLLASTYYLRLCKCVLYKTC